MSEHDVTKVDYFGRVRQFGQRVEKDDGFEKEKLVARNAQIAETMHEITAEEHYGR